jgi:hypothetical protein
MADGLLGGFGDFLLGGGKYADPNAINPQYGVPESDVRQAGINTLANVSALLLAAGQPMTGAQRAQMLAQIGPAMGGMTTDIYKASQARLMTAQQQRAMRDIQEENMLSERMKDPAKFEAEFGFNPSGLSVKSVADLMRTTQLDKLPTLQNRVNRLKVEEAEAKARTTKMLPELLAADTMLSEPIRQMIASNPDIAEAYVKSKLPQKTDPSNDYKNYMVAAQQAQAAGQPVPSFVDYMTQMKRAGAQQVTIGGSPMVKGIADKVLKEAEAAETAANTVRTVQNARSQFDQGIVSGIQAPVELQIRKVLTAFGNVDPKVSNTEAFQATMAPLILELVQGLGAGTGISNADRDFARDAAGGRISLDNESIARLLEITERMSREKLARLNKKVESAIETDPEAQKYRGYLNTQEPPAYTPPKPAGAAIGGTGTTRVLSVRER